MILKSLGINHVPSPHYSDRGGFSINGTVIHYTATSGAYGAIKWFSDPASKVSAHFVIDREGTITQMVDLDKAAWHAGISEWYYKGNLSRNTNQYTIGIELCNRGRVQILDGKYYDADHVLVTDTTRILQATLLYSDGTYIIGYWEKYPAEQIRALHDLLNELQTIPDYRIAAANLVGHEEIAVPLGRKSDPGPLFPWQEFGRSCNMRKTMAKIGDVTC